MSDAPSPRRSFAVRYADALMANRLLVAVLAIAALLAMAFGGSMIGFKSNYRVFFGKENPELAQFEAFQETYSRDDNIIIVVQPRDGTIFNRTTLGLLQSLTEQGWFTPSARRVDSITNFQHTFAQTVIDEDGLEEDQLIVRDLVETPAEQLTDAELAEIRRVATTDPLLTSRLVPEDGRTTAVLITTQLRLDAPEEIAASVSYARALIDGGAYFRLREVMASELDGGTVTPADMLILIPEAERTSPVAGYRIETGEIPAEEALARRYPDHHFALSGTVMLNNAFTESAQGDFATLIPAMFGLLLLGVALFLRSVSGMVATLAVIIASSLGAMGMAGWLGIAITPPSATSPIVIMTLAVADSVHFLVTMLRELSHGRSKQEAIRESLRVNLMPIFLTSLTTFIGFLSLNLSDAPPFRDLGNIVAMGVLLAFVYSVTLLPILASMLPFGRRAVAAAADQTGRPRPMMAFADWILARTRAIGLVCVLVVTGLAASTLRLDLNDDFVRYFDERVTFRTDTEFLMDNLTGIYTLEVPVRVRPDVLRESRRQQFSALDDDGLEQALQALAAERGVAFADAYLPYSREETLTYLAEDVSAAFAARVAEAAPGEAPEAVIDAIAAARAADWAAEQRAKGREGQINAMADEVVASFAGINEPEMTHAVEDFSLWLRGLPQVAHVYAITDIYKRLNQNFNQDQDQFYRIPDSRQLTAQYRLVYENSLRQGLTLTDRIASDNLETRVTVTIKDMTSREIRELETLVDTWFTENNPEYLEVDVTGVNVLFSHISERNIRANLIGAAIAFVLISIAIGLALRSVTLGLLSLIPNMVPALMAFGLWSFINGQVNLGVAVVASVSLGIIVDDTVHLLAKYRRARLELGLGVHEAIRYAFDTAGPALIVTTIVLSLGFGLLAFSSFAINGNLGLLTAVSIAVALVLDFLLVPVLLTLFDRDAGPASVPHGPADAPPDASTPAASAGSSSPVKESPAHA